MKWNPVSETKWIGSGDFVAINISVYEILFSWLVIYYLFIFYFFYLSLRVCLSVPVCLHPINVKMAETIGPTFLFGNRVTPGKVDDWIFKNLPLTKFVFWNPWDFFFKFLFIQCTQRENVYNWKRRWDRRSLKSL